EPRATVSDSLGNRLLHVARFWEKPSPPIAETLFRRGCFWNTFITVGYARTFLELVCAEAPQIITTLTKANTFEDLEAAYNEIRAVDFSRDVLTQQAHRLAVLRDAVPGWTDLGTSARVIQTLHHSRIQPAWSNGAQDYSAAVKRVDL